jgi:ABC-type Mn2+/Zn2+ transport system permease subunit
VHRFSAIVHAAADAAVTGVALAAAAGGPVECGLGAVARRC